MKFRFFTLTPDRILYDQFWVEVRNRNRWLILLRYGAVLLFALSIAGLYLLHEIIPNFGIDTFPLWIIAGGILLYNIGFDSLWIILPNMNYGEKTFHSIHFSLLQLSMDLVSILMIIYFTGGVESPIYALFIIIVVLCSFYLPGKIVISLIGLAFIISLSGALLEYYYIIPHHKINGLFVSDLYKDGYFLVVFFILLFFAILMTLFISNSIAKELYAREKVLTEAYHENQIAEKRKVHFGLAIVNRIFPHLESAYNRQRDTKGAMEEKESEKQINSLNKAIHFIDDLKLYSNLELDFNIEAYENVNIHNIIDGCRLKIEKIMESRKIDFSFERNIKHAPRISAIKNLLTKALDIVLENAIQYAGNPGKIILNLEKADNEYIISISDNGVGITDEETENIFNPFKISPAEHKSGNQIGLAIARRIIDYHHGDISFNSPSTVFKKETNPGTDVIIRLPITKQAE